MLLWVSDAARHIRKPGLKRHTLVFQLRSRKHTSPLKVLIVGKNNWAVSYKKVVEKGKKKKKGGKVRGEGRRRRRVGEKKKGHLKCP